MDHLLADLEGYILSTHSVRDYIFGNKSAEDIFITVEHDFEEWEDGNWLTRYPEKRVLRYTFSEQSKNIFHKIQSAADKHAAQRLFSREQTYHCYPVFSSVI